MASIRWDDGHKPGKKKRVRVKHGPPGTAKFDDGFSANCVEVIKVKNKKRIVIKTTKPVNDPGKSININDQLPHFFVDEYRQFEPGSLWKTKNPFAEIKTNHFFATFTSYPTGWATISTLSSSIFSGDRHIDPDQILMFLKFETFDELKVKISDSHFGTDEPQIVRNSHPIFLVNGTPVIIHYSQHLEPV